MSPGFKFNEWELKGVPLRLEIGNKEIENNEVTLFRRDLSSKTTISIDNLNQKTISYLNEIQDNLFNQANNFMDSNIHKVSTYEEFSDIISTGGFVRCGWDGTSETENIIKDETKATIRCIPFNESSSNLKCIRTGNNAKHEVIFAKAY